MILVNKKFLKEIWWYNNETTIPKFSIIRYCSPIGEIPKQKNQYIHVNETLITSLNLDEEQIMANFNATTRTSIRKVEKTNPNIKMFSSEELLKNKQIIKQFLKTFNTNYKALGLRKRLKKLSILSYINSMHFYLSVFYYQEQPIVYHTYLENGDETILLHSASYCRTENKIKFEISRNEIGLDNRYLHYKDMLFFKEKGISKYNWGGITSSVEPNNIDKFKMQFNGTLSTDKTVLIPNNLLGKIIVKLLIKLMGLAH